MLPRSIADRVKSLPELNIIKAARRNIHLPAFRKYLEKECSYIKGKGLDRFIEFIDEFLEYYGKGMAYIHWQYGISNPDLYVGKRKDDAFTAHVSGVPRVKFGRPEPDPDKIPEGMQIVFRLTDHYDENGQAIMLPHHILYDLYTPRVWRTHNGRVKSIIGEQRRISLHEFFMAVGAHEAFHNYDYTSNPDRYMTEMKSYAIIKKRMENPFDDTALDELLKHPIEQRAQQAAREALAYYKDKPVNPSLRTP